jgi:hypothetical protein
LIAPEKNVIPDSDNKVFSESDPNPFRRCTTLIFYVTDVTHLDSQEIMMKRWLFWIICLGLISSCSLVPDQIKESTQSLFASPEKPLETAKTDGTVPETSQNETVESVTLDDSQDESLQVAQTDNSTVPETSQPASFQVVAEKAQQGDAEAQYKLGMMYLTGKGVIMPDGVCNPVRNVKSCVLELTSTLRTGIST